MNENKNQIVLIQMIFPFFYAHTGISIMIFYKWPMKVIVDRLYDLLPIVRRKRWIYFCGRPANCHIRFHCFPIHMSTDPAHFTITFWTMIMKIQAVITHRTRKNIKNDFLIKRTIYLVLRRSVSNERNAQIFFPHC